MKVIELLEAQIELAGWKFRLFNKLTKKFRAFETASRTGSVSHQFRADTKEMVQITLQAIRKLRQKIVAADEITPELKDKINEEIKTVSDNHKALKQEFKKARTR